MSGTVYLVGAGPGSLDLLTVRAARLIAAADVVVHDRLVGSEILGACRPTVELIDVSKRPGEPSAVQNEINAVLIARARADLDVVRLKGGDPFVFGRGGEEAAALAKAGIPFEVVPGISSAFAAPGAAGIPVTHRETARSVTVITGHAEALDSYDWSALGTSDTLVVLMGAATVAEIERRLLGAGLSPTTPAAVIQDATFAGQREVRVTLAGLAEGVVKAGLHAPLVIVIGAVAKLDVRSVVTGKAPLT